MATIPTIPTFHDGPPAVTATQLNALGQALTFQLYNRPLAKYRQSTTTTSVPTGNSAWTTIAFDVTDVDTDGGRSGSGAFTDRYVCRTQGWYTVHATLAFAANNTGDRLMRFLVNASAQYGVIAQPTALTGFSSVAMSKNIHMNVGDTFQVQGIQTSGVTLSTVSVLEDTSSVDIYFNLAG